jgi:hypothetical protein
MREPIDLPSVCACCNIRSAVTRYDGDDLCQRCAFETMWRDLEEGDDMSGLMGG